MTPTQTKRAIEIMQKHGQDGWKIESHEAGGKEWVERSDPMWNWNALTYRAVGPRKRVELRSGMEVKSHAVFAGLICVNPVRGYVGCFDGDAVVDWLIEDITHYRWPNGDGTWLPIEVEPEIISMEGVE